MGRAEALGEHLDGDAAEKTSRAAHIVFPWCCGTGSSHSMTFS